MAAFEITLIRLLSEGSKPPSAALFISGRYHAEIVLLALLTFLDLISAKSMLIINAV